MAYAYLYPTSDTYDDGNWTKTGASIWQDIDDTQGAPDNATTHVRDSVAAVTCKFRVGLSDFTADYVRIIQIEVIMVSWDFTGGGGTAPTHQPYLYIGTTEYNGTAQSLSSAGYVTYTDTWTTNPATSAPWTKSDLNSLEIGIKTNADADQGSCTSLYVKVTYSPLSAGLTAARQIGSHRLRRNRRPIETASMETGPEWLDLDLLDDFSVVHFMGPHASDRGWGMTNYKRRLFQAVEKEFDPNSMTMRVGSRGRRGFLCTLWDTGEASRTSGSQEDGVAILTTGGTVTHARNSSAWPVDPGSGLAVERMYGERSFQSKGRLLEQLSTNYLPYSSFVDGTTGWSLLAGSAAVEAPTDPVFDSAVGAQAYVMTAGISGGSYQSTLSDTATSGDNLILSVDHRDTGGDILEWELSRTSDSSYWDDTSESWGAKVTNSFPGRSTRTRDNSNLIPVDNGDDTYTLNFIQSTNGQVNRVYHVQLENSNFVTSRIVSRASGQTRNATVYKVSNNSGARAFNNAGGTFFCELTPEWGGSAIDFNPRLFKVTFDSTGGSEDLWEFYFDAANDRWTFRQYRAGAAVTAYNTASMVAGTTYKIACRWASSAGEHGLTAYTLDVFVDGVKGTSGTPAGVPTEATPVDLYIGGDASGNACAGELRRILFTQEVYSDAEIARL